MKMLVALMAALLLPLNADQQAADEPHDNLVAWTLPADGIVHIKLEDVVTDESVKPLIDAIGLANEAGAKEIDMSIDSPGGSVASGLELMKVMETSAVPVVCTVNGMAASMALSILESCGVRLMTKRSILMAHEPAVMYMGRLQPGDTQTIAERLRVTTSMLVEHLAARFKVPAAEIARRIHNAEWWMDSADALKFGAVDALLPSPNARLAKTK